MIEQVSYAPEAGETWRRHIFGMRIVNLDWARDFLRVLAARVSLLRRHPTLYPTVLDDFRRAPLRVFRMRFFTKQ